MKLPVVITKLMLILLCALQATEGLATHLMGGEAVYEYVGDGNFLVTVIQYRDCSADLQPGATSPDDYCDNCQEILMMPSVLRSLKMGFA